MSEINNTTNLITGIVDRPTAFSSGTTTQSRLCNRDLDVIFWSVYGVTGAAIVLGNTLTCMALLSTESLRRNVMNTFLTSLAVSDIFMAVVIIPGFAVYCSGCAYSLTEYCWVFGGARDIAFMASVFNLLAITYDRYIAVLKPLHYLAKMTKRRVIVNLSLVWLSPLIITCLRNIWQHTNPRETVKAINTVFNNILVFCFVITPIFILITVNIKIIQAIKTHRRLVRPGTRSDLSTGNQSVSSTSEARKMEELKTRKGTLSCVSVVAIFIICWLPRAFYNFFYLAGRVDLINPYLVKLSLFFLLLQSSLNPFVYSFYRKDFRIAAARLLKIR